jgi:hypothetical protein
MTRSGDDADGGDREDRGRRRHALEHPFVAAEHQAGA